MRKRIFRRKPYSVDGQRYEVSLTATYGDVVRLRLTIRADFANRSFCTINGLRNFDYYHNYGYWNDRDYSETSDEIAVTPRLIAALIRYARQNGWSPETARSNHQIAVTNIDAKSLLNEYTGPDDAGAERRSDSSL